MTRYERTLDYFLRFSIAFMATMALVFGGITAWNIARLASGVFR